MADAAPCSRPRPPPIMLTTPDGLYIETTAPGSPRKKRKAVRFSEQVEDITALLSEPPVTPTRDSTLSTSIATVEEEEEDEEEEETVSDDSSATLVSPCIDQEMEGDDDAKDSLKNEFISYWAVSSSAPASASDSDSDSDSDEDMDDDLHYYGADTAADHDGIRILCTDPNGLVSFPPLQLCPSEGGAGGRSWLGDADEDDVVMKSPTYYERLWGFSDEMIVDAEVMDAAAELQDLVDEVEKEYAEGPWRTSSFSSLLSPVVEEEDEEEEATQESCRPVPQWAWLTDSNSFPVVRPFRHGQSKLRQSVSIADAVDEEEEKSSRSSSRSSITVAMAGISYL